MTERAEQLNIAQDNALSELRERIQAKRELTEQIANEPSKFVPDPRVLVEVPDVDVMPDEIGNFRLERFMSLQKRLDALYGNFIYWKDKLLKDSTNSSLIADYEHTLIDLIRCIDSYVSESIKARF